MKHIIFAIFLMMALAIQGQDSPPSTKMLIADETEVVQSGKNSFRVVTCNDSIAFWVRSKYEYNGIHRITYTYKKHPKGDYWERSFYFNNEHWRDVTNYIIQRTQRRK